MNHPDPEINALLSAFANPKLATIDLSLTRMERLLILLGHPERHLPPVVHVAGTNGKGSLIAYLTAMLTQAGYKVHRYISPHLVKFNERIMLSGEDIDDKTLRALLMKLIPYMQEEPVTFFEATTAASFLAFAREPADILLLETGLGGRLDATNLVEKPILTAITPISYDHCEYLGYSLPEIAGEKAGILKAGVPCVVGPQKDEVMQVLEQRGAQMGATLYRAGEEWSVRPADKGFYFHIEGSQAFFPFPNLTGNHQIENAATAIACAKQLHAFNITPQTVTYGITHAIWPARLQRITEGKFVSILNKGSELWLDGGHNPAASVMLADWVQAQKKPVHIIVSMLKNKDIKEFLAPLAPYVASLVAVPIENEPMASDVMEIYRIAQMLNINSTIMQNIKNSIENIENKKENNIILVCGSLYLAGNMLHQNTFGR